MSQVATTAPAPRTWELAIPAGTQVVLTITEVTR